MAENEQKHRHSTIDKLSTASVEDKGQDRQERKRGQICALVVAVAIMAAAVLAVWLVPSAAGATVGSVLGGSTVTGLVTVFILGRKPKITNEPPSMTPNGTKGYD